ncbi:MAG: H-NS histone family protein [Proteobacteria bacterium]|mgnify:CR=1 FL=1|nr:H-NS histone family protein [Pseudomonadota bacterium]MBS0494053.1 H-NS histone family protein [Pseudomonadota bacterium]
MTPSYKELLKQREALELQITEAHRREKSAAVAKVRELISEHGLTQQDVFPTGRGARVSASSGVKVAPKYRDPATGQTWTGRGKAPKWIQNVDREKFAIAA